MSISDLMTISTSTSSLPLKLSSRKPPSQLTSSGKIDLLLQDRDPSRDASSTLLSLSCSPSQPSSFSSAPFQLMPRSSDTQKSIAMPSKKTTLRKTKAPMSVPGLQMPLKSTETTIQSKWRESQHSTLGRCSACAHTMRNKPLRRKPQRRNTKLLSILIGIQMMILIRVLPLSRSKCANSTSLTRLCLKSLELVLDSSLLLLTLF